MIFPEEVRQKLPSWKRMGYEPHWIQIEDQVIVFRTLTKGEFEEFSIRTENPETDHLGVLYSDQFSDLLKAAVLYPVPIPDDLPASTDLRIAEAIVEASSWVDSNKLVSGLEEARRNSLSLDSFLQGRILSAFPSMTLKEVKALRFHELMNMVAMSEVMTGVQIDLQPWLDPDAYMKKMKKGQRRPREIPEELTYNKKFMRDPDTRRRLMEAAEIADMNLHQKLNDTSFDLEKSMREQHMGLNGI